MPRTNTSKSKPCEHCGTVFTYRAYRESTARFCSKSCTSIATREQREPQRLKALKGKPAHNNAGLTRQCKNCGKLFSLSPSRMADTFWCSSACYWTTKRANAKTYINPHGYRAFWLNGKHVLEHRYIMEQHIGRKLNRREHVHHINGNRADNRLENLELLGIHNHSRLHASKLAERAALRRQTEAKACLSCGKIFTADRHGWERFRTKKHCSRECANKHRAS